MNKIMAFFFLMIAFQLSAYETIEDEIDLPLLAPSYQEGDTKKIRLDNGIDVYLISDPRAEKSAASLSVNAGSWEDPKEHPGLAHFLEHMLFMGTKKYPDEASFSQFIKQYGGKSNAFTEDQYTTFLFEINTEGFPEALDRFSQFFIAPLLKPSGISREIQAVEQEFSGHSQKDDSRRILIYKELGNPNHPFSKFNFGNHKSLSQTSTDDLRKWYKTHYSANKMRVVLYSPLPMKTLVKLAVDNFSSIPNKNLPVYQSSESIFSSKILGKILYIEPVQNDSSLMMVWELPKKFAKAIDTKPDELICHILGHEGKESLLMQLRKEGLALELGCGATKWGTNHLVFIIKIELTAKGAEKPFDVVTRVYQTIARLKEKGIPPYIFDEVKQIGTIKFQYPTRESPFKEVTTHSQNLRYEPFATYPEKTTIIQKYDPNLIQELLSSLTPDQMILDLMASPDLTGVSPDRKEKWMGTAYAIREIPNTIKEGWLHAAPHPKIDLPKANTLIPRNLNVIQSSESHPKLLIQNEFGKAYFVPDQNYRVPKISWTFRIFTPSIDVGNPKSVVLTDLYLNIFKEQLNPFAYLAKIAELEYDITQGDHWIELTINGYSDKAQMFLKEILNRLAQFKSDKESFNTYRETLEKKYSNIENKAPYLQAIDLLKKVIYERYSTESEKALASSQITYSEFQNFIHHLFDETYIEALFYGNLTSDEATDLWGDLKLIRHRPYPLSTQPQKKVAVFPENKGPFFLTQPTDVNGCAVLVALQDPDFSFKHYAAQDILWKLSSGPFFEELRTKQQTAYLITNIHQEIEKVFFSFYLLQSYSFPPRDLLARIELFLESFLGQVTEESFKSLQSALVNELRSPPENMKKRGTELAAMAFDRDGDFQWKEKKAQGVEELTFEEFRSYISDFLGKGNKRRLALLINGKLSPDVLEYKKVDDLSSLLKIYSDTNRPPQIQD